MGKFFTAIIILAIFLSTLTQAAIYSGGSGTAADPYQINSKADLLTLAATTADYSKCFILTSNIDLTGETFTTAVIAPDTVVDDFYDGTPFTGNFNGNGRIIFNLNINTTTGHFVGLFGDIGSGGQVANLGLVDAAIKGKNFAGGLAGHIYNPSGCVVSRCYVTGTVTGDEFVGGLCGYSSKCTFSQCHASVTVTGNGDSVGGLCGQNYESTISQCYATGTVEGVIYVGGLCGYNYYSTISQSYATGAVEGIYHVGGLCGENFYRTISQSYATGAVTGGDTVGGLCGENYSATISQCYATGAMTTTLTSPNIGGLCGYQVGTSARIQNSFWNTNTCGCTSGYILDSSHPGTIINVVGKTTVQMKKRSTFTAAGWDFTNEIANGTNNFWRMCTDGVSYPKLSWQSSANGDLVCADGVDTEDLTYFIERWLLTNCTSTNNYCGAVDMDYSGKVDLADLSILAANWMRQ